MGMTSADVEALEEEDDDDEEDDDEVAPKLVDEERGGRRGGEDVAEEEEEAEKMVGSRPDCETTPGKRISKHSSIFFNDVDTWFMKKASSLLIMLSLIVKIRFL